MLCRFQALILLLLVSLANPLGAQDILTPDARMALFSDFESQLLRERGDLLDLETTMAEPIWIADRDGVRLMDGALLDRRIRAASLLLETGGITPDMIAALPFGGRMLLEFIGPEGRAIVASDFILAPIRSRSADVRASTLANYDDLIARSRAAFTAALVDRERPRLPPALQPYAELGLRDCNCVSSDGRNDACRNNGCAPPAGSSMQCLWECNDREGSLLRVDGVTRERLR